MAKRNRQLPSTLKTPTPSKVHRFNPHGLDAGDRVILPDGTAATIKTSGFRFAKIEGVNARYELIDLRPYQPEEEGKALFNHEQLSLF